MTNARHCFRPGADRCAVRTGCLGRNGAVPTRPTGVLAGQVGVDIGATIDPNRALAITRACTRAFVDLHLRGKPHPLMTAPSSTYQEVTFIA
jgi:hypothetical protein